MLREKDPPHRIALGAALGALVGMMPIMGIQMITVAALALPLRANLKASLIGVWISNPVTFLPMYYGSYRFGLLIVDGKKRNQEMFARILETAADWDWGDALNSLFRLFDLGTDVLVPLWLGSIILGTALAVPTYALTYRAVVKYRERVAKRKARKKQSEDASLRRRT
ncbi:MAG: DUF2062 domain-containing protein [Polyangia bacterium]